MKTVWSIENPWQIIKMWWIFFAICEIIYTLMEKITGLYSLSTTIGQLTLLLAAASFIKLKKEEIK